MSQQLSFSHSTVLKAKPVQSSELPFDQKINVKPGDVFTLRSVAFSDNNHALLTLAEPLYGRSQWYGYVPHLNIKGSDAGHEVIGGNPPSGRLINPSDWRANSIARGIKRHFEGCFLDAYLCPAGVPTIGWGNTYYQDGSPVRMGDRITQEQADALADSVLGQFVADVANLVDVALRGSAVGAITSFAYNVGVGNFAESTFLKRLNSGHSVEELQYQLRRWCRAGDGVLPGLVARRNCEAAALAGLDWRDNVNDYTVYNS